MWIYVPSGQDLSAHRTFFFKGGVSTSERTPSAFFAPSTSKLLLQLSTEDNPEESIDSKAEVVQDSWTHYVFKLEESQYSVFVDGVLDSALVLSSPVIRNEADLLVGWAPGLTGPKMIAANIEIWAAELTSAQIGSMYSTQRPSFSSELNLRPRNLFIRDDDRHVGEMLRKLLNEVTELMNSETCNDPKERMALWVEAASLNSDVAALHAGEMHLYGTEYENLSKRDEEGFCALIPVKERSSSAGIEFLRAAANLGNGDAMYKLSMMISSGIGISGMLTLSESNLQPLQPSAPSTSIMIPPLSTSATSKESITSLSLSLLHQAAAAGHANAALSLAHKYQKGYGGVEVDSESSSYYAKISADAADVYYHIPGNQPYHQQHRLRVGHEADLIRGEQGEDDGELQYIIMMAEKGDVDFMASYAGMLYWGARGFERDHPKALELWNKAAAHDHVGALCGAASMYVRGEGTEVDVTKAVEYYERAAAMDSATALNGLGYAYFFGQGELLVDKAKALTYFMRAVDLENDADSLTNAAHCYATGQGAGTSTALRTAETTREGEGTRGGGGGRCASVCVCVCCVFFTTRVRTFHKSTQRFCFKGKLGGWRERERERERGSENLLGLSPPLPPPPRSFLAWFFLISPPVSRAANTAQATSGSGSIYVAHHIAPHLAASSRPCLDRRGRGGLGRRSL